MATNEFELVLVLTDTNSPSRSDAANVEPVGAQVLVTTLKYQPLVQSVPLVGKTATIFPCLIASERA